MLNHRRLLLSRILALAVGLAAALTTSTWAQSQWTQVGPAFSGTRLLAVERGAAPAPGVAWWVNAQEIATTHDRGASWRFASTTGPLKSLRALAADGSTPRALWALTDDALVRTTDGGAHWRTVSDESFVAALDGQSPTTLSAAQGWVFVASRERLAASADGGKRWRQIHEIGHDQTYQGFAAQPRSGSAPILYLSFQKQGYYSETWTSLDGGDSWTPLRAARLATASVDRLVATPAAVFASLNKTFRRSGIYRSTDHGATWTAVLGGRQSDYFESKAFTVDPRSPRYLYAYGTASGPPYLGDRLWRSGDGGATWSPAGKAEIEVRELLVETGSATLYVTDGETIARSLDRGATWSTVLRAPDAFSPWAQLTFREGDPARRVLTVGRSSFLTTNSGASWRSLPSFHHAAVDIDPNDPNRLLGVGDWFIYLSTDGGASWQFRFISSSLRTAESFFRLDDEHLLIGGCGVTRTTDNGLTWRETLPCEVPPLTTLRWTEKLEADPTRVGVVYALGFVADSEFPHGLLTHFPSFLWRSNDLGGTWKKVANNLRAFAVDPRDGRLLGVRGRTLLASDDLGETWHQVATTPWPFDDLAIDPLRSDRLFGLRGSGDYVCSGNGGESWSALPHGGPRDEVGRLFVHPADPRALYAASRWSLAQLPLAGFCE